MKKRTIGEFLLFGILSMFICAPLSSSSAAEKKYPTRYIELSFGYPGGGAVEVQNRILAQSMEKHLGVSVISVSKPGGGGVVACNALINAPPDGYTVAQLSFNSICQTILLSKGALTLDDIKIVGQWNIFGSVMSVPADSQWKTFQDLVDFAKKNPGVKFAHPGVGNSTTLRMENLNRNANLKMVGVPFKGDAEVVTSLLGKHFPVGILSAFSSKAQAEGGKLRILFSFDPPTMFGLDPNIPYLVGSFDKGIVDKDIELVGFMFVPRKTPEEVVKVLEKALEKACKEPELMGNAKNFGMAIDFIESKTATQKLRTILERVKAIQE